jgi:hypothetical protein
MPITITCPGCSATLQLEETATSATCPYCGNHFEVKMDSGVAPELSKTATPPPEPILPTSVVSELPAPALPSADPDTSGFYNPPVPGVSPIIDLYDPPLSGATPPPDAGNYAPPPFYTEMAQKGGRLTGSRLWIAIAIGVFAIFCISCLCMVGIFGLMVKQF